MSQWGHDGFLQHADRVASFYLNQREVMLQSAEKHLSGLYYLLLTSRGKLEYIYCVFFFYHRFGGMEYSSRWNVSVDKMPRSK